MATQARNLSIPIAIEEAGSGSLFTQFTRVLFSPARFFRAMPANGNWIVVALLVLAVAGYTATMQTQSAASGTSGTASAQTNGFDLSLLDADATADTSTTQTQTQTNTSTVTTDESLTSALLAGTGIVVLWLGQTALLSLVSMFRGYAPQLGKSFQVAVWASIPLALMLVLRHLHYAAGGTGGALGLSLLLDSWSGYSTLTEYGQRIAAIFMSNLTLFWLWNVALLYLGARHALGGRRFTVFVVIILWVVASTLIPALVSEPETRTAPRPSINSLATPTNPSDDNASTTQTQQTFPGGDFAGGNGNFPGGGGAPQNGGNFPGGGGAPPGN